MGTPDPREHVRRAIHDTVRAAHGPAGFTEQPAFPGASTTEPTPDPVAAFTAARVVAYEAHQAVIRTVGDLRSAGHTWTQVADILDGNTGTATAEDAFTRFATPGLGEHVRITWHCPDCDRRITDLGPGNGHPVDCETGHGEGCARHAVDIAAYEAWRDEQ